MEARSGKGLALIRLVHISMQDGIVAKFLSCDVIFRWIAVTLHREGFDHREGGLCHMQEMKKGIVKIN